MSKPPLMIKALGQEPTTRPPVWLMRQAGRYMAEYRALKEKFTFLELCRSPELAVEISLQPMKAFDMDASIIFSDILIPLEPMGISVDFNPGPCIANKIVNESDVNKLKTKQIAERCSFVGKAISGLKKELSSSSSENSKAVLGFAGAPWTLACYMLDQGPLKNFAGSQVFAAQNPKAMGNLLNKLADVIGEYLLMQIESGADAVQIFDTWAGLLPEADYREFALPPLVKIVETVQKHSSKPIILYINGCSHLLEPMLETGVNCLSIDSCTNLAKAYNQAAGRVAIQGNFESAKLFMSQEKVERSTKNMLRSLPSCKGFIANLGHGVLQRTPSESVKTFVNTVKTSHQIWDKPNAL